ncbi:MAG: pilus assembly protein PilM [Planctomycetes bacterium]|nr:pilus assembly protein PilM [Planctomycetota bacterium]
MLKQKKSIVGLDIGTSCIKAVELTQEKYDFLITGYAQVDVTSESARQDAIAELMRAAKFRSKRVATAVSGKNVIFRYISMAEMSEDKVLQAVTSRPTSTSRSTLPRSRSPRRSSVRPRPWRASRK